jgi:hypothetical protein
MATERYQFPLNDTDYYNGKIIFQVRIEEPPEISLVSGPAPTSPSSTEGDGNFVEDAVQFGNDILGRTQTSTKTITRLGPRATLFMPQGLQFADGVVYERADLGRIGGAAEAAVQNGSSVAGAVGEGLSAMASQLTELFNKSAGSPDAARLVAARAAKFAGADIAGGVQSALRVATNPNTRQLFREVAIRDFNFTFKLIPVSKEEAEMATALIKFFRTELYPEDSVNIDVGGASIPIGYRFPNTFDISFKHKDRNIIHRLLPCYLVGISTVYNGTGAGFFEDGNFTEIEVSMAFRESRTLTKRLVSEGGY